MYIVLILHAYIIAFPHPHFGKMFIACKQSKLTGTFLRLGRNNKEHTQQQKKNLFHLLLITILQNMDCLIAANLTLFPYREHDIIYFISDPTFFR